jgi:hypothetical protein
MNTPDLVQELGFRVLDEEDDDPVLLRANGWRARSTTGTSDCCRSSC